MTRSIKNLEGKELSKQELSKIEGGRIIDIVIEGMKQAIKDLYDKI